MVKTQDEGKHEDDIRDTFAYVRKRSYHDFIYEVTKGVMKSAHFTSIF